MTEQEYIDRVKRFDWYYPMSEDMRVVRRGDAALAVLERESQAIGWKRAEQIVQEHAPEVGAAGSLLCRFRIRRHQEQESHGPDYECSACGQLTRNNGAEEAAEGLCGYCFEDIRLEAELSDGNLCEEQYQERWAQLRRKYNRE